MKEGQMKGRVLARIVSNSSFVLISVLVAAFAISCAGPNRVVGYQGRLTDASGNPINGNKSITFRFWDHETSPSSLDKVFEETRTVAVTNGLLNVDIGALSTDTTTGRSGIDPSVFTRPLWLELVVDGQTLSPRQKLLGAPYAMTLVGGAVVSSSHEGNGPGGSDETDQNYGTLTVVATSGGTALAVGILSTATGDAIRVCNSGLGGRSCTNPIFRVLPNGNVEADGSYTSPAADFAERLHVDPTHTYVPGDVIAISRDTDRTVTLSDQPYSTAVVGVYSTKPGFVGGSVIEETAADGSTIPVALVGIVPVKVSAENGAIHRGDLLTTSATLGHAMKASEFRVGTIVGKAMGELESGTGIIQVLLTLQ
jgi:hypothetical protein